MEIGDPRVIEWHNNFAFIHLEGNIRYEMLRGIANKMYGDSRLDSIQAILLDCRKAKCEALTEYDIQRLAIVDSITSHYKPELKIAFVIDGNKQRSVCETYIGFSKSAIDSWQYSTFICMEDAKFWIE